MLARLLKPKYGSISGSALRSRRRASGQIRQICGCVRSQATPAGAFGTCLGTALRGDVLDAQKSSDAKSRKRHARYAVGYGRPPTSSQFQPGQSGNPNGRPKGVRNASSMARDALERTINVKVKRAWRKMTVRKAAYLRLAERAVAGDAKALDYLLALESEEHPTGLIRPRPRDQPRRISRSCKIFFDRRRPSLPRPVINSPAATRQRRKGGKE